MKTVATIGVYGWTLERFLDALRVPRLRGSEVRAELAPEYRERYRHEILEGADLDALVAGLPAGRARRPSASSATRGPATAR